MRKHLCWDIVKRFSVSGRTYFALKDVAVEFPEKNRDYLSKLLAEMARQGMLCRIVRNSYLILPLDAHPESYQPDALQLARCLVKGHEYYIAYASAMQLIRFGRLQKDPLLVVTRKQLQPPRKEINRKSIWFIQHTQTKFFGFEERWINQHERAMVSDVEKTLVDIATRPQLGGGIVALGLFLVENAKLLDQQKLFYYLARNMSLAAKKRVLYLSCLFELEWTESHEDMVKELGSGLSLLDPDNPMQGKKLTKFGLKLNHDPNQLREKVEAQQMKS